MSYGTISSEFSLVSCAVDATSVGKPRAKVVASLLQELNDSCSVKFVEEHPHVLLENNPKFFQPFNLIICTQVGFERGRKSNETGSDSIHL